MSDLSPESVFERVQAYCLSCEDAAEDYPWGHVVWKIGGKLFAIGSREDARVTVKSTIEKQAALIQRPDIEIASHVGRYGWVTITVRNEESLELTKDLIDESYDSVRPRRKRAPGTLR